MIDWGGERRRERRTSERRRSAGRPRSSERSAGSETGRATRWRRRAAWAAPWVLVAAWACGPPSTPHAAPQGTDAPQPADPPRPSATVSDANGHVLDATLPRARVVSLVPSLTEAIVAFGGDGLLVGRTPFDHDPRIAHVPVLGGMDDPDLEAVVAARPDLVVTWADAGARAAAQHLRRVGVPVFEGRAQSLRDFREQTLALGSLLGRRHAADSLVRHIDRSLAVRARSVPEAKRPSVLVVVWPDPLVTTGRGTFVDEVIRLVGGRGLFDDVDQPWPTVSFESVLERGPDVILVTEQHALGASLSWVLEDPRWRMLAAVREGRAHLVDGDVFNRPGPRVVEAADRLRRLLDEARR